jgi:hypothetical protein
MQVAVSSLPVMCCGFIPQKHIVLINTFVKFKVEGPNLLINVDRLLQIHCQDMVVEILLATFPSSSALIPIPSIRCVSCFASRNRHFISLPHFLVASVLSVACQVLEVGDRHFITYIKNCMEYSLYKDWIVTSALGKLSLTYFLMMILVLWNLSKSSSEMISIFLSPFI